MVARVASEKALGLALVISSVAAPLAAIAVAAALSGWFDVFSNALSDLGHATRSAVAPVFNTGLSLGGLLMSIVAVKLLTRLSKTLAAILALDGYALILVAVFDEVYGRLHFAVSVLFFALLGAAVLYYGFASKSAKLRIAALALFTAALASWIAHLAYKTPRGAAVPELVSVIAALPVYFHACLKAIEVPAKSQLGA